MRTKVFCTSRPIRKGDIWRAADRTRWLVLEIIGDFADWSRRQPRHMTRFVAEVV